MNRRRFLTTSLSAAGAGALGTGAAAQGTKQAPEYYELRQYHLRTTMRQRFSEHFRDDAVPAYNRAGIANVGVERRTFAWQDIRTGGVRGSPVSPESKTESISGHAGTGVVAWIREPNVLEVWQLADGELLFSETLPAKCAVYAFRSDGRCLAVADKQNKRVILYEWVTPA